MKVSIDFGDVLNNIDDVIANAKEVAAHEVNVGITSNDSELQMIANVHEYGASINVTDKMRGWFGANGYPLKADTRTIKIPERSFLRTGKKKNEAAMIGKVKDEIPNVLKNNVDVGVFMKNIGDEFAGKIQDHMRAINSPPNSSMTIERKGSSNPLIDTGRLLGAIDSEVVRK